MQVIQQNLKAVGIQLTPDNLTNTDFDAALYNGKYQLAYYDQQTFGPSPYYELRNWLDSAGTAPIGQQAATNYERYSNPATDKLFTQYASSTSATQQHAIMNQIQGVMLVRPAHHPGGAGGGLVPVRRLVADWLAHARQPLRPAVRVRLPGHGAGAAAPQGEVTGVRARGSPGPPGHAPPRSLTGRGRRDDTDEEQIMITRRRA